MSMDDPVKLAEHLLEQTEFVSQERCANNNLVRKSKETENGLLMNAPSESDRRQQIKAHIEKPDHVDCENGKPSKIYNSNKWKNDILSKIGSLEKELDEIKLAFETQRKPHVSEEPLRSINGEKSALLYDVVSSKSSSPIKNRTSNRLSKSGVAKGSYSNKKKEILEAKCAIDRGFKTAREINEKWELLKRKQKAVKDASLQVSLPESVEQSDDELKICHLAKKLTNLLLERPSNAKSGRRLRANVGQSVVISQREESSRQPSCRLSVQRLPDNYIRDALSTRALPSIAIPPAPAAVTVDNTKLYCLNHSRSSQSCAEMVQNLPSSSRTDVGLQVDLSDSSSGDDSISQQLKSIEINNKISADIFNETQMLRELLKKVEESGRECKKYVNSSSSNITKSKKSKSRYSSISDSNKRTASINNDYKSDFEVESLEKDIKSLPSISRISTIDEIIDSNKRVKTPRNASWGSVTSSNSEMQAVKNKIYPSRSNTLSNVSTDESILEAQMKRLGISPERVTTSRKSARLKPEMKQICIKHKRIPSPKFKSSPHPKTLYIKSDGKFIPVDPLESPKVQIIVPEIVVKLPEAQVMNSSSSSRHNYSVRHKKHDQVIQTDEGIGTLTGGDASSVVEKLNKHFERTQLLLERIGPIPGNDVAEQPCNSNVLSLLYRRTHKSGRSGGENSAAEKHQLRSSKSTKSPSHYLTCYSDSDADQSQSIGEISDHCR